MLQIGETGVLCLPHNLSLSLSLSPPLPPPYAHNSEYESVFVNQRLKWRVKGKSLRCVSSGVFIEATVLAEELAYNKSLRQYKMFILERPLDPNFKVYIFNTIPPHSCTLHLCTYQCLRLSLMLCTLMHFIHRSTSIGAGCKR